MPPPLPLLPPPPGHVRLTLSSELAAQVRLWADDCRIHTERLRDTGGACMHVTEYHRLGERLDRARQILRQIDLAERVATERASQFGAQEGELLELIRRALGGTAATALFDILSLDPRVDSLPHAQEIAAAWLRDCEPQVWASVQRLLAGQGGGA